MKKAKKTSDKGAMTVAQAGRKGGITTRDTHDHEHFVKIGKKGGRRVRDLIAAGKRALGLTK